ncbi:MAG: topology modulation protein [Sphingomicrobium sp.]
MIIGPCGSGKSTLSFDLADKLDLPLTHMDQLNWLPGWVDGGNDRVRSGLAKVIAGDRWLIEGNYGSTLAMRLTRADTVVYLDFQIRLCLWRLMKRIVTGYGQTRPDMTVDCPERFDPKFILYVMGWNHGPRPRTEAALSRFAGRIIRLRSPKELARWLSSIEA